MPRAGWRKPESDRRLSDLVSVGVLTRVFPPALVDEVIAEAGRTQQRHRALPARVMAYFAIGMGLYSEGSYEDVLAQLTDGLAWASGWRESYRLPGKSAIFQARERLGSAPLAGLFARVATPLAGPDTPGAWLAGRRLVAIDGTCLDVADTPANDEHFGRPGVNKGEKSAFPQARVVALAECGTHAMFAAGSGSIAMRRAALAETLLAHLDTAMLLLADRGFFSYTLWRKASRPEQICCGGYALDSRAPAPVHLEDLPDGSWLADLRASQRHRKCADAGPCHRLHRRGRARQSHRLPAADHAARPDEAPRTELAAAYAQRWEIETRLRRTQNPPTRTAGRAAIEISRSCPARDLGPSVLPLRDPHR